MAADVLMRISFRAEADATRGNTAEHYRRGFRPMSAAMSACRNSKLCPCLLATIPERIKSNSETSGLNTRTRDPGFVGQRSPVMKFSMLWVQRQTAAVGVLLRFFGLGVLSFEISKRDVQ